eukprot:466810-Rhodomonas_salina.1
MAACVSQELHQGDGGAHAGVGDARDARGLAPGRVDPHLRQDGAAQDAEQPAALARNRAVSGHGERQRSPCDHQVRCLPSLICAAQHPDASQTRNLASECAASCAGDCKE